MPEYMSVPMDFEYSRDALMEQRVEGIVQSYEARLAAERKDCRRRLVAAKQLHHKDLQLARVQLRESKAQLKLKAAEAAAAGSSGRHAPPPPPPPMPGTPSSGGRRPPPPPPPPGPRRPAISAANAEQARLRAQMMNELRARLAARRVD